MRRRWETRRAERERIARELHDTLLQSVQGLIFRLRTEVERLPGPERARIGVALERAVGVVDETRQKIQDLRSNPERSLGDGVDEMRGELTSLYEIPITRRVDGNERGVDAFACAEIVAIVREALSNACRHSHGTRIDISLGFRTAHLYVSVRDNGKGMIQELASAKARSAHWGLHGMHERARILSASLSIRSRVGKGTTVLLKVPAETAYTHPSIQTDAISQPNTGDVSESAA
jgi:signal transduction histidine kinase